MRQSLPGSLVADTLGGRCSRAAAAPWNSSALISPVFRRIPPPVLINNLTAGWICVGAAGSVGAEPDVPPRISVGTEPPWCQQCSAPARPGRVFRLLPPRELHLLLNSRHCSCRDLKCQGRESVFEGLLIRPEMAIAGKKTRT